MKDWGISNTKYLVLHPGNVLSWDTISPITSRVWSMKNTMQGLEMLLLQTLKLGKPTIYKRIESITNTEARENYITDNFRRKIDDRPVLFDGWERAGIALDAAYSFVR